MVSRGYYLYGGLTLVELAVIVGLLGLVAILTAPIYMTHFSLFSRQNAAIEVASQNRLALDDMVNQIREAQTIVSTCADCSPDVTGSGTLVLQVWPVGANGEPFEPTDSGYDYIIYKIDSSKNQLVKRTISDSASFRPESTKIIAADVASLQFAYNNADPTQASQVTINLTNQLKALNKTQTIAQEATAVLRNK
ncbi:hypothetical protein A2696_02000 [Candidatus Curtissbacteria bacterium RIFCSPHIGHO2_01_FULL_41_13]|uniref:Prepilin-type N-terminal cleavage/methylation domain-containing protein n=1 Tax=Candidatus Curtissbacteria bacterium RIFCSPHIGHO2_01_FULL_41_13 TaxID=1797745 RepID=A0A1F5FY85_9BACT|nr:MAG: hypothetical protein A2696_02000 [Candidatus Curtissbacteria bacterium RIFCSPHIGHO2_01_FULL_41_13]